MAITRDAGQFSSPRPAEPRFSKQCPSISNALHLRYFALPSRVFVSNAAKAGPKLSAISAPPLPASALEAAKHAAMPLPRGAFPEVE